MITRQLWPLDDPPALIGNDEQRLQKFRDVRDEIGGRIAAWVAGELNRQGTLTTGA